jgi:SAM-dependent methyltransferase
MDLREIPEREFARHPWETARLRFFSGLLRSQQLLDSPVSVLDGGSGDAFFAGELAAALPAGSHITCFDINYTDTFLAGAATRDGRIRFTRDQPRKTFDLLLLLDVLEHVPDDRGFLSGLVERNVRRGGHALMSVPAHMNLFTRHDVRLGHYRRYDAAKLRRLAVDSGLQPVVNGGLFHSLLLPRALQKLGELARNVNTVPEPELSLAGDTALASWKGNPVTTGLLTTAMRVDNAVSGIAARVGLGLPGLSTWMLARKT